MLDTLYSLSIFLSSVIINSVLYNFIVTQLVSKLVYISRLSKYVLNKLIVTHANYFIYLLIFFFFINQIARQYLYKKLFFPKTLVVLALCFVLFKKAVTNVVEILLFQNLKLFWLIFLVVSPFNILFIEQ